MPVNALRCHRNHAGKRSGPIEYESIVGRSKLGTVPPKKCDYVLKISKNVMFTLHCGSQQLQSWQMASAACLDHGGLASTVGTYHRHAALACQMLIEYVKSSSDPSHSHTDSYLCPSRKCRVEPRDQYPKSFHQSIDKYNKNQERTLAMQIGPLNF